MRAVIAAQFRGMVEENQELLTELSEILTSSRPRITPMNSLRWT
jgi:hypothetical protein